MFGQLGRPRHQGLPGRQIGEVVVGEFFQEILKISPGIQTIFLGGFNDAIRDRAGLGPAGVFMNKNPVFMRVSSFFQGRNLL